MPTVAEYNDSGCSGTYSQWQHLQSGAALVEYSGRGDNSRLRTLE